MTDWICPASYLQGLIQRKRLTHYPLGIEGGQPMCTLLVLICRNFKSLWKATDLTDFAGQAVWIDWNLNEICSLLGLKKPLVATAAPWVYNHESDEGVAGFTDWPGSPTMKVILQAFGQPQWNIEMIYCTIMCIYIILSKVKSPIMGNGKYGNYNTKSYIILRYLEHSKLQLIWYKPKITCIPRWEKWASTTAPCTGTIAVVKIVQAGLGALRRGARSFATRSWVDAWRWSSLVIPGHPPAMPHDAAWKKAGF